MRKTKTKKAISLVLTLMFVLSIFAVMPAQEAEASTTYKTLPVRNIEPGEWTANVNTVTVVVDSDVLTAGMAGRQFRLDMLLPGGFDSVVNAIPGQNVSEITPAQGTGRSTNFTVTLGGGAVVFEYEAYIRAVQGFDNLYRIYVEDTDVPDGELFSVEDGTWESANEPIASGSYVERFFLEDEFTVNIKDAGGVTLESETFNLEEMDGWFPVGSEMEAGEPYDPTEDLEFQLEFANLKPGATFTGDIFASFTSPPEDVTPAPDNVPAFSTIFDAKDVLIARVGVGEVTVTMVDVHFITDSNVENMLGPLRFTEQFAGAMKSTSTVEVKLPRGFYWDSDLDGAYVAYSGRFGVPSGTMWVTLKDPADLLRTKYRTLVVPAPADLDASRTSSWQINANELSIIVDPVLAAKGDVIATVSGKTVDTAPSEITVARYGDYVATATALSEPNLLAGKMNQKLGSFEIREEMAGSLLQGRTISLTLPEGAKWIPGPGINDVDDYDPLLAELIRRLLGDVWWTEDRSFIVADADAPTLDTDESTLRSFNYGLGGDRARQWMIVDAERRTIRTTVTDRSVDTLRRGALVIFKDAGRIAIEPTFAADGPTDLTVEVGGTAGAAGEIVLGKVWAPVYAELDGDPVQIIAGQPNQALPDVHLTESLKGAAARTGETTGIITLRLPDPRYSTFAQRPSAEVVDGDMVVERIWMSADRRSVNIQVVASSDVASTIKVSDLEVTLDRAVPYGDFKLQLTGDAIIDAQIPSRLYFLDSDVLQELKVASVVDEIKPVEVMMWIGSTTYTVDGVAGEMDVAPFIENDRTFVPVRFIAQGFGVSEDDIAWGPEDGLTEWVTIEHDGKLIEIEIGSNVIMVTEGDDTYTVLSDVAAQIINDRTYLPIRAVGEILGAEFDWGPKETLTEWVSFTYWK